MPALDGVKKDFGGFLDALEEGVVFRGTGCSAFVGVVPEDFFAVGGFNLRFCSAPAVAGETEDSVVILALRSEVGVLVRD